MRLVLTLVLVVVTPLLATACNTLAPQQPAVSPTHCPPGYNGCFSD